MRELVRDYNRLLEGTLVDIPKLNEPVIIIPQRGRMVNQPSSLSVEVHAAYSATVHGTKMAGFHGGWWQRTHPLNITRTSISTMSLADCSSCLSAQRH